MTINEFIQNASKRIKKQSEIKEISIEDKFVKYAKNNKCKAIKLILLNKRGFPDRTVLCPGGRIFFIEFKRKGKILKRTQSLIQIMLTSFGFKYYKCDKSGQAEQHLKQFIK